MDPAELAAAAKEPRTGFGPWSHSDYLAAAIIDRLDALWHATCRIGGAKVDSPQQYPRPGIEPPGSGPQPDPTVIAFIERQRAEHLARQAAEREQAAIEPAGDDIDE